MRILFIIPLLIFVVGCVRNDKIPKGVIRQNEMRKLMWDLMRADAYVNDFVMKDSSCDRKTESAILYEEIFRMHATNREKFEKSLDFYETRPDLLKTITDSLRVDERKAAEYPNTAQPQADTTLKKIKLIRNRTDVKK
jgi:hypothetical protein